MVYFPVSNGAFVRTEAILSRGPNSGVISKQFFPIHPNPARLAATLCENTASKLSLLSIDEAGIG